MTDDRRQMTEDRRQMTEDRGQKTEEQECGSRNAECGIEEHRTEEQECGMRPPARRGHRGLRPGGNGKAKGRSFRMRKMDDRGFRFRI